MRTGNDIKRSSPLISAGVQSSEGLCYGILGTGRQETSALIAHRTGETVQIFRSASLFLLQIHAESLRPTHSSGLARCQSRDCHSPFALMPDKAGHRFQRSRSAAKRFSAGGLCPWLQIFRQLTVESNPSQPPHGRCHNGWAMSCF